MVWVLLVFAGLSETVGRILPLIVRHHRASRALLIRLLITGTLVEALVFALWPTTAWFLAGAIVAGLPPGAAPTWTAGGAVPLLLTGILAFPLLGPALHLVVLILAGAALADQLAAATELGGWPAIACVAGSGMLLAFLLAMVRRVVGAWGASPEPEWAP